MFSLQKGAKQSRRQRLQRKAESNRQEKPYKVDSGIQDALSGDLTEEQILEGNIISLLGVLFTICFLLGITVAASVRRMVYEPALESWCNDTLSSGAAAETLGVADVASMIWCPNVTT
jgi:hypothetical protein